MGKIIRVRIQEDESTNFNTVAIDIDAPPRPEPNTKLRRFKRLLALQQEWDLYHKYEVDKCDGFCCGECTIKGCMLRPSTGELWSAEVVSSLRKNLVSLMHKLNPQ